MSKLHHVFTVLYEQDMVHVQTNMESVQCLCIKSLYNWSKSAVNWNKNAYIGVQGLSGKLKWSR